LKKAVVSDCFMHVKRHAPARRKAKSKASAFVLDGSVTVAWFFEDEANAYAVSVEDALAVAHVIVPGLWSLEVTNALLVGERRKRASAATVTEFLRLLSALPIAVDEQTSSRAFADIIRLARTHHLTAYDAAYLEVALRHGLPIATLDNKLRRAAEVAGVERYLP
jgi:predicted nucleic acid-binding protein